MSLNGLRHRLARIEEAVGEVAEQPPAWVPPFVASMSAVQRAVWDDLVSRTPSLEVGTFDTATISTDDLKALELLLAAMPREELEPADSSNGGSG